MKDVVTRSSGRSEDPIQTPFRTQFSRLEMAFVKLQLGTKSSMDILRSLHICLGGIKGNGCRVVRS
jgi:hypothetical protein